jgi:hypothetical protein
MVTYIVMYLLCFKTMHFVVWDICHKMKQQIIIDGDKHAYDGICICICEQRYVVSCTC